MLTSIVTANPLGYLLLVMVLIIAVEISIAKQCLTGAQCTGKDMRAGEAQEFKEATFRALFQTLIGKQSHPWTTLLLDKQSRSHPQLKIKDKSPFSFNQALLAPYCSSPCPNRPRLAQT